MAPARAGAAPQRPETRNGPAPRLRAQPHSPAAEQPEKRQQSHARPGHGSHTLSTKTHQHSHAQPRYKSENTPAARDATAVPGAAQDTDTGDTTAPNTPGGSQERARHRSHAGPAPRRPSSPRYQDTSGASQPGHTDARTDTQGCPGEPWPRRAVGAGSPAERSAAGCECDRPPPRLPINHPTQGLLLQALTLHWLDAESSPVNDSREEHTRGVSSSPAPSRTPTPPKKKKKITARLGLIK